MNGLINGMKYVESLAMVETKTYQRRKHRVLRINKKWRKKYGIRSVSTPKKEVYVLQDQIIGHPETIRNMMNAVNNHRR